MMSKSCASQIPQICTTNTPIPTSIGRHIAVVVRARPSTGAPLMSYALFSGASGGCSEPVALQQLSDALDLIGGNVAPDRAEVGSRGAKATGAFLCLGNVVENSAGEDALVLNLLDLDLDLDVDIDVGGSFLECGGDDRKVLVGLLRLVLLQGAQGAQQFFGTAAEQGKRLAGHWQAVDDFDPLLLECLEQILHVVIAQCRVVGRGCALEGVFALHRHAHDLGAV